MVAVRSHFGSSPSQLRYRDALGVVPAFGGLEFIRSLRGSSSPPLSGIRARSVPGAISGLPTTSTWPLAATEEVLLLITTSGWILPPEFLEISIVSATFSRDSRNLKVTLLRDVCIIGRLPTALQTTKR